jgi:hypothetical protein
MSPLNLVEPNSLKKEPHCLFVISEKMLSALTEMDVYMFHPSLTVWRMPFVDEASAVVIGIRTLRIV